MEGRQEVAIVDVNMPFMSMVILIIKMALASIPAVIILSIIFAIIGGLIGGIFGGLAGP